MKKVLFIPIISLSLFSCADETPKCESYDVTKTVKEVIQDLVKSEYMVTVPVEQINLELIRTTNINKEIKQCDCEATVNIEDVPYLSGSGHSVIYNAQTNENDDIVVSAELVRN